MDFFSSAILLCRSHHSQTKALNLKGLRAAAHVVWWRWLYSHLVLCSHCLFLSPASAQKPGQKLWIVVQPALYHRSGFLNSFRLSRHFCISSRIYLPLTSSPPDTVSPLLHWHLSVADTGTKGFHSPSVPQVTIAPQHLLPSPLPAPFPLSCVLSGSLSKTFVRRPLPPWRLTQPEKTLLSDWEILPIKNFHWKDFF